MPVDTDTIIIGAGPAGLAVGTCLQRANVPFIILERNRCVGSTWHHHYDRLHLHTDKARSELPYLGYPRHYPRYPSRRQMIDYLEMYAYHFELQPRFGQEVVSAVRQDSHWRIETGDSRYRSRHLVIATGYNRRPYLPHWPGQEQFTGPLQHSSMYRNGRAFRGKRVLVVGFGNSAAEIALDLYQHGATSSLSVRGPVNVIPLELLRIPILAIAIPLSNLPPRVADLLTAPILRFLYGDSERFGLRRAATGPFAQIARQARIPVIDIGTMALVREGQIAVYPGIERFTDREVVFADGRSEPFDAVILATGYRPAIGEFLDDAAAVTDERGDPLVHGEMGEKQGLYFCGFYVSPTGVLREIALEARRIAADIAGEP